jgi:hypothetical protein
LEARQLLALLVPIDTADVTGLVAVDSSYQVSGVTTEAQQKSAQFSGTNPPSSALVEIDRGDLLNAYGDSSIGTIERQIASGVAHLGVEATASTIKYTDAPDDVITARASSVTYDVGASTPIVLQITPEAGESVGDMVGVMINAVAVGQIFGVDAITAPSGAVNVQGTYRYEYRILSSTSAVLSTHSGSGAVSYDASGEATLDDFHTGPINVPIGSQIEITLNITGTVNTSDLNATGQVHANLDFDVVLTKADLVAEALTWNAAGATDQASRKLDFSYYVDGSQAPLSSNTSVEFYWSAGSGLADVIGSLDSPLFSYAIDEPGEKTTGSHSSSVALSQLGTPPEGATSVLMVIDRQNAIAEVTKSNNIKTAALLPDVEMVSLAWNTRREADPYGGWRGVDLQYEVHSAMATAGEVVFYWASDTTLDTRIGEALSPRGNDSSLGLHQFNEPANWGQRPDGAKYVLAVFDPENFIQEWNEQNNVLAIAVHTAEEILNGSLDLNPLGSAQGATSLTVWFKPGGGSGQSGRYTVSEAEVALGVEHFNWYQQIQNVPNHWTLYQDQNTSGSTLTPRVAMSLPWIDPSNQVPNQSYLVLESTLVGSEERFASTVNDSLVYYYNEPNFDHSQQANISSVTSGSRISFTDAPRVPSEYLAAGESWQFVTSLVGVDADGNMVALPLASQVTFTWKANTVYDRSDPNHPVSGGGVFLQALDESLLPPAVAGGVFDVSLLSADPPVAAADAASTVAGTAVVIRVTANDYDPLGRTLRILSAGTAEHGSVRIADAGTPDDWADDYVLYTPNDGYVGQDHFEYLITRIGDDLGYASALATITVQPAISGLGVIGDSMADEYADQALGYAKSWVELLAENTAVDLGASGVWSAPRDSGYEQNWAQVGATSQSSVVAEQTDGLLQQIRDGAVSQAVVAIGQEDFLPGEAPFEGIYYQGLSQLGGWTSSQIADYENSVVASVTTVLAAFKNAGARPLLVNLVDFGVSPVAVAAYPDAARRNLVSTVIADINLRIADLAAEYRVPLADVAGAARAVLGTGAHPVDSAAIGGLAFTNTAGAAAQNLFTADGIHPHTVVQAVYANVILEAFRLGYATPVSTLSEEQIVEAAGLSYGGQDTLNLDYAAYVLVPANQIPVAQADRYAAVQGTLLTVDAVEGVLGNDADADLDRLRAVLVDGGPAHGTLTLAADGSFTYRATTGYVGADGFSYVASDGHGNSQSMRVEINVLPAGTSLGDSVGLFASAESYTYLRNSNTTGAADQTVAYGSPGAGWLPIAGDWDGNGSDTLGLYDPAASVFYLTNSSGGIADMTVAYGAPGAGWLPIAGDWNGDGLATIALYDPQSSVFYFTDSLGGGMADRIVAYGAPGAGWLPIAGDWTGQGFDTLGLYDPASSTFYLRDSNTSGMATIIFGYGAPGGGWLPVVGDWNGNQVDTVGLYDPTGSCFYLRNSNSSGYANVQFGFGQPGAGWIPIAGNWNGSNGAPANASASAAGVQNSGTLNALAIDAVDLAAIAHEVASATSPDDETTLFGESPDPPSA